MINNKEFVISSLKKSGYTHVTYNEYFEIENKNVFAISPNKDLLYISINNTFHVLDMCDLSLIKNHSEISVIQLTNNDYIDINNVNSNDILFKDLLHEKDNIYFVIKHYNYEKVQRNNN